ncbi:MAG: hypothetical protein R3F55_11835 [Alphaproteobacteria bacterium]
MTKIMILVFGVLTAGAGAATFYGVGAESFDIDRSVRGGSAGNGGIVAIK